MALVYILLQVTQYSCNYPNLAPPGCTQYFFGANSGTVRTFNFNNNQGHHLANQDQTICVRRERTMCRCAILVLHMCVCMSNHMSTHHQDMLVCRHRE